MTTPAYGLVFLRDNTDPRPALPSDLSVIGLVLPSDDADADFLPLNVAVEFNSGDQTSLLKLGTGDLKKEVLAIDDQLAQFQSSARVVAVRVAQGVDIDATIDNIVGDQQAGTGIYALLQAGQRLGVIPRLIGAPGYTGIFNRTDPNVAVSREAKSGGNTGTGLMTLPDPSYGTGVQNGVYVVRCLGGARSASSAEKAGGNAGDGTMGSLTADATAAVGAWRVICNTAEADGGIFIVLKPDGSFDGVALVGTAYNSSAGINFTIADGAADFEVGDEFVVTVAASVPGDGGVFSVVDPHGAVLPNATVGVAYDNQIKFTIGDGATDYIIGDGFDVTVVITGGVAEANPICAALPAVLNALLAHAIVGGPGTGKQDTIDWFETLTSGRLIPVDDWVKDINGDYRDGAGRALGALCRVDFKHGGYPGWSFSGEQCHGILGLKNYWSFSLTDGATDGQILLANHIGIISRGEVGVETAIASNGFVFAGVWNADTDPLWWFYNKTRMRDWAHLALLKSIRLRLGVENVTPHGVQAVLNDMVAIGVDLIQHDVSIGFRVGFEAAKNNENDLRQGKFRVFFQTEEPAPITQVTIDSRPYYAALTEELGTLVAQANTLVPQFIQ